MAKGLTEIKAERRGRQAVAKAANQLSSLKIVYVPLNELRPNDYNPNRQSEHDFELLLRSMEEDGFTQPIIAHAGAEGIPRGTIVDGEHRWRAAAKLGHTEIPVVFVDMTPEQMKIATLRHNRARGSEDLELSVDVLRDLQQLGALDWAKDSLMISDDELNRLLEDIPAPEALAAPEFGRSWEPSELAKEQREATDTRIVPGKQIDVAMSLEALEAARTQEKALKLAHTAEQREMIHKDGKQAIYSLKLVFSGSEAEVIKAVLGERPAEAILALCREKQLTMPGALETAQGHIADEADPPLANGPLEGSQPSPGSSDDSNAALELAAALADQGVESVMTPRFKMMGKPVRVKAKKGRKKP
jgi:ParB-like chromosome segregation protein Spo0J